jgi:hypothetical protein
LTEVRQLVREASKFSPLLVLASPTLNRPENRDYR